MIESKIRLNMVVPGATILSSQACEEMAVKDAYEHQAITVKSFTKKGKKQVVENEIYHIHTRKSKPAKQIIVMSKEAYEYMLNVPPHPKYNKKVKVATKEGKEFKSLWDTYSINQKLKAHFDLIAADFNAISYTFEILEG